MLKYVLPTKFAVEPFFIKQLLQQYVPFIT